MIINFYRGSKKKRVLAESIMYYVADKLMPRLKDKLEINLHFVTKLTEKDGVCGDTIWEDDDVRPREFTIRLDASAEIPTMLRTLAHEMVHVKQFARGELKQYARIKAHRFKSEFVSNDTEYWDLPWEIEAHGREEGLYLRWLQHTNHIINENNA